MEGFLAAFSEATSNQGCFRLWLHLQKQKETRNFASLHQEFILTALLINLQILLQQQT